MRKKGFTIIEVALVLAIAGLIFLMVFITLPQVWRNQRDTQRRDDMLTFVQKLKNYQTNNNRGALPSDWNAFYDEYLGSSFTDPLGQKYNLKVVKCSSSANAGLYDQDCTTPEANAASNATFPNGYTLYVVTGAKCNGERAVGSANVRKVAVLYKLEGGGVYCGES